MTDDFTEFGYRALLHSFLQFGYEAVTYEECDPSRRHLLLRHDIDMSPNHALTIAQIEAEIGLRATYFVLVRTSVYNPFSGENLAILREILRLGHQMGLHFDASLYVENTDELNAAVQMECEILEGMLGQAVQIVSFHRPSKVLLNNASTLGGRQHTYSPRYFRDIAYCSDSRGEWHYGHPLAHDAIRDGRPLQLLTHPIWWCGYPHERSVDKLDRLVVQHLDHYRAELARNCSIYRKEILRHLLATT